MRERAGINMDFKVIKYGNENLVDKKSNKCLTALSLSV
jgi:hypothetical protein